MPNNNFWCSSGPVRTMPDSSHSFPKGEKCDSHNTVLAVARIQTETDSMGCEYALMCQICLDEFKKASEEHKGTCDYCKNKGQKLVSIRDYDEGMSGRLYDVCIPCRENVRARELEEAQSQWDDW